MTTSPPSRKPLLAEQLAGLCMGAYRSNRVPFLSSLLFGLLAYMFAFTNKLPNHDEVGQLFGKGATFSSGRFGLEILEKIFPNFSMPWIYGVMTIVIIAIAICFIVRIFSIENRLLQVLLSGCIMVFPSLIGVFGYMFTSTSYAVSFLMAVVSVWCICRKSPFWWVFGLGSMAFSLSIYQSYISVAASLLVLVLIQELLHGEDPMKVLKRGIFFVLFLVIALGGYYIANQLVMKLRGVQFNNYAADSITFSLSSLPAGIVLAYAYFFQPRCWQELGLVPTPLGQSLHFLFLGVCLLLLFLWIAQNKDFIRAVFLLVLLLILPLSINCMYLITSAESIHTLVLYSFTAVYVLASLLVDVNMNSAAPGMLRQLCMNLVIFTLSAVILLNTYIANQAFLNLHLKYENAYGFYVSLMSDLRSIPQFDGETELALCGIYEQPAFYADHFGPVLNVTGIHGFLPDSYTNTEFLEYYLGISIPMADAEKIRAVMETPEYEAMAVYPYHGSIQAIGDLIVVRLS